MTFNLTWTETSVEIQVEGDFPNQMVAINRALTSDPRSKQIRAMLFDVLRADTSNADGGLVSTLADIDFEAYAGGPFMRVAVLTKNKSMASLAAVYAERFLSRNPNGAAYAIFPDRQDAEAWLMLPRETGVNRETGANQAEEYGRAASKCG